MGFEEAEKHRPKLFAADKLTLAIFVTFVFCLLWLGYIFIRFSLAEPLCCADDAAISLVAKSIANGHGYALPMNFIGESGDFRFDPGISTGATLILPAAAMLAIFGNQPWIPGFTSALISIGLLCWVGYLALRRFGLKDGSAFGLLLLCFLFFVTSGKNFSNWYALIGEIPASLLILSAIFYLTEDSEKKFARLLPGILVGLAVQSKLLALLALPSFVIFALWGPIGLGRRARDWWALAVFLAGFMVPTVAFEMWRLSALGLHGYIGWYGQLLTFMQAQVPGANENTGGLSVLINRAAENSTSAMKEYGHGPWDTAAYVVLSSVITWVSCARSTGKFFLCLMLVVVTDLAWWTLFSNGWQRYELIGMLLAAAALASVAVWRIEAPLKILAVLVAGISIGPVLNPQQLSWFIHGPAPAVQGQPGRLGNLQQVLVPLIHEKEGALLIGSWWASLVEAKFVLPDDVGVVGFNRLYSLKRTYPNAFLLINKKWDAFGGMNEDLSFTYFREKCGTVVQDNADFTLYKCDSSVYTDAVTH